MTNRISGTSTEYNTIHQYRLRHSTKTGVCEHCKEVKKTQWANKSGQYKKYDDNDWLELCSKCHTRYDINFFGKRSITVRHKCRYCRQFFYRLPTYSIQTKYHVKSFRLCNECYKLELAAQSYYDGLTTYEDFIIALPV